MKCCVVFFALVAFAAAETYNTEHDDLDVQKLVSSVEMLQSFLDCFVDKGPCNEVQQSFKDDLSEAVEQACAKCTAAQKNIASKFVAALQEKLPNGYAEFKNKYDPEGKYFTTFVNSLN